MFHKWGAAYRKEQFVMLRVELTDGWRKVANADDQLDQEGWTIMRSHR